MRHFGLEVHACVLNERTGEVDFVGRHPQQAELLNEARVELSELLDEGRQELSRDLAQKLSRRAPRCGRVLLLQIFRGFVIVIIVILQPVLPGREIRPLREGSAEQAFLHPLGFVV